MKLLSEYLQSQASAIGGFAAERARELETAAGLPEPKLPPALQPELMIRFANWVGDWDAKWNHYKWHKLESGHRALGDTIAMITLLEKMASSTAA